MLFVKSLLSAVMSNFVCRYVAQDPAIKDILNINENVPGKIKVK